MESNREQEEFKEQAIPFIIYNNDTSKFELTQEAEQFLKRVPGPLGLVAVAGMYRTGKSYLLNRMLLDRSNGFGVGPSINPCTKGLWVWGKPIRGITPEGESINVLIVDTEGLGALDEDSNHDVRIFSLAILLSSYFLYNSVGSIDESALSNLSLVINLTKHIHIKSKGSNEDMDTEEYGTYFPSFMWVVRDFTLQLVNENGDDITPKEYFDKALQEQKGFSDNVEQKNRIRKLLKSFFKDRDCCTLIRPLTNEDNLQNLVDMELSDLRPDFQEQVLILRRKVLHRVKPKMLNGKKLTGSMMVNLAHNYVHAINNGVVPNIENAWNYICKNECGKAMEESLRSFDENFKDSVLCRIPMEEEDLKASFKEAKGEALALFTKKVMGSNSNDYLAELKQKMREVYQQIYEENERESAQQSQMFLEQSYSLIDRKLKHKEFTGGFAEYEQDMKAFQHYFMENGPAGPYKRLLLLEFVQQATIEASDFFQKNIQNELDLQTQIAKDHMANMEGQLKEMKGDFQKDKEKYEGKLRSVEVEKAELQAMEQSLRENLERVTQEKKSSEAELSQKIESVEKERKREIEELKNKIVQSESQNADIQRQIYSAGSEFEKDKALLEQKIEFLEKTIQDQQKKETEYSTEMKTQKKDFSTQIREMQQKYETQIKELRAGLDEKGEALLEAQGSLEELESKYSYERQKWEESQESLKNNANISQTQFQEMQRTIEDLKNKSRTEVDKLTSEMQEFKDQAKFKEEELEGSLRDKEDELKSLKTKFEKELAIYQQKLEFKEVQSTQLKTQLEEQKRSHDSMIKSFESKARDSMDGKEHYQKKMEQLKEIHDAEVQKLEKELGEEKQRLEKENEQLGSRCSELELELKGIKQDYDKEVDQLKSQLEDIDTQRERAVSQNKSNDTQRSKMLEETELRHKQQILALERELEDEKQRAEQELKEVQTKSEESLQQLKSFYEIEKKRLETRVQEEKDNVTKKINAANEECEGRIKYEIQLREDEVEELQEQLRETEHRFQSQLHQLEHDYGLAQQKIETLETVMKEKEERFSKDQTISQSQMEQQFERFNTERKEMNVKIEQLGAQVSSRDREIALLRSKLDSSVEDLEKRKKASNEQKEEYGQEKQKLNEKIEGLRQKNQELSDEFIQKKLEDAREIAIQKQRVEFHTKKIEDLQKQNEELVTKYEERLQSQKQDYHHEIQESYDKMNAMKEQLEQKYEAKRRHFKEQENQLLKQVSEFNKEKAVLEEKALNLEQKKEEIRQKLEGELEVLKSQLGDSSQNIAKEREILLTENEKLKGQLQEMEKEYSECSSAYERDKALWDGKFQFLEQQRDMAKQVLQEQTKKFEMTLEQVQKRGMNDKEKQEMNQNTLISSIESKFKQQLKENQDKYQRESTDLVEKCKVLEKENRQLQSRLQLEQRDKMSDHGAMEKKVGELMENEIRLGREIEELKAERDRKVMEHQKSLEKEREVYKTKLQENESKYKEIETKRSSMVFEMEKERARWGIERDQLGSQKSEVQEQLERLQRRHEIIVRENEKLKSERNNRKYTPGMTGQNQKLTPQMFGQTLMKSLAKENSAVSSSQAFAQGFSKYIADGASNEKADPNQLPLSVKDNQSKVGMSASGLPFLKSSVTRQSGSNLVGMSSLSNAVGENLVAKVTGSVKSQSTDEN